MPPAIFSSEMQPRENVPGTTHPEDAFRQQWSQPADVFSVLLLLGGDVVNKALAQLAGGILTPVSFSFGWVSYAVTMLLASVGDTQLMPPASDGNVLVVTAKNGYMRPSTSWVLSRMLRDYDGWMDPAVRARLDWMLDQRHLYMQRHAGTGARIPRPTRTGLCISVYEPSTTLTAGEATRDMVYWSGLVVLAVQLLIAAAPLWFSVAGGGDWSILAITACGSALALLTGSLPQWRAEKWACRRGSHTAYILTRGNGSQHAMLVLGNGRGLNLEDLAVSAPLPPTAATRLCLAAVALLWVMLLVTAAGVRANTPYLLAVGGVGILQNVVVVGWRRSPGALGVHVEFRGVVGEMTAMDALLDLEAKHPQAGRSLLPIFFPGTLLPHEVAKWDALEAAQLQAALARKQQPQPQPQQGARQGAGAVPALSAPVTAPLESWAAHAMTYKKTN